MTTLNGKEARGRYQDVSPPVHLNRVSSRWSIFAQHSTELGAFSSSVDVTTGEASPKRDGESITGFNLFGLDVLDIAVAQSGL
jgi:hypothetical protein